MPCLPCRKTSALADAAPMQAGTDLDEMLGELQDMNVDHAIGMPSNRPHYAPCQPRAAGLRLPALQWAVRPSSCAHAELSRSGRGAFIILLRDAYCPLYVACCPLHVARCRRALRAIGL